MHWIFAFLVAAFGVTIFSALLLMVRVAVYEVHYVPYTDTIGCWGLLMMALTVIATGIGLHGILKDKVE